VVSLRGSEGGNKIDGWPSLDSKSLNRRLVPLESGARTSREDGSPAFNLYRFFEHGGCPIDIFEPVARGRDRQKVCADLRE
jgi:hypothetical protein